MIRPMVRDRLDRYQDRIRRALLAAFREQHTPHEVAISFAIGIFVTAMPTGGLGIGLFFLLAYWFSWVSKPAMFASIAVMNPLIKPAVYVASYQLGAVIFGTQPLVEPSAISLATLVTVGHLLLVGNLVIATGLAILGYVIVYYLTVAHRRRGNGEGAVSSVSAGASIWSWRRK